MFGGHAHGRIGKSAHGKLGGRVLSRFRGSVRVVSAGVFSTGWMGTNTGKLPVEPVGSARRSKRLEGVRRQYVVEPCSAVSLMMKAVMMLLALSNNLGMAPHFLPAARIECLDRSIECLERSIECMEGVARKESSRNIGHHIGK